MFNDGAKVKCVQGFMETIDEDIIEVFVGDLGEVVQDDSEYFVMLLDRIHDGESIVIRLIEDVNDVEHWEVVK